MFPSSSPSTLRRVYNSDPSPHLIPTSTPAGANTLYPIQLLLWARLGRTFPNRLANQLAIDALLLSLSLHLYHISIRSVNLQRDAYPLPFLTPRSAESGEWMRRSHNR
ncbi:hypothetical protein FRB91_011598 [Serendipita sp. 411]|nr:hypothetical protein FRC19_010471 [Serendipita sp. 401]KAG8831356.1 hypothetical protein FRC18_006688 [Serendipita sp. 400]KAG8847606.1 hypothetical protein FRB91_011598 [Serendipita sp. 411]